MIVRRAVVLALTLALAATACSGDSTETTTTTVAPSTTVQAPTTAPSTSTTSSPTTTMPATTTTSTAPTPVLADGIASILAPEDLAAVGLDDEFDLFFLGDFTPNPDPRGPCGAAGPAALPIAEFDEGVAYFGDDLVVFQFVAEYDGAIEHAEAVIADAVANCPEFLTEIPGGAQQVNVFDGTVDLGAIGYASIGYLIAVGPEGSEIRIPAATAEIAWPGLLVVIQIASQSGDPAITDALVELARVVADRVEASASGYEGS